MRQGTMVGRAGEGTTRGGGEGDTKQGDPAANYMTRGGDHDPGG